MSKAVKSVGRAIGKVFKGAVNVVKKVAKSPLGKIALTAAAVYFGVPAVQGLMGGGATGTVMGNLSSAWSGLSSAASSVMAGNFGQAGSQLAGGFMGSAPAGTGLVGSIPGVTAPSVASPYGFAGANIAGTGSGLTASLPQIAAPAAGAQAGGGILGSIMSSPYAAPALIQAGSGMLGAYANGKQQQEQYRRAREEKDEDRQRYSSNMGTRLWGVK